MEQLGFHCMDFREILYLSIFRKSIQKIQVSLKSDNINGYSTWTPIHIYDNIPLNYSKNEKVFRYQLLRQSKHKLHVQ
jgi:hypothetical protein